MSDPKDPARPITTRAELDRRRADRPRLVPVPHLTPPGLDVIDLKKRLRDLNEARIKQLETRLKAAGTRLRHDLRHAKLKGRSRGDFDRSR
ncbi:MAG: hypothetical protein AAGC70_19200 [Pseudomonadota bacterium]